MNAKLSHLIFFSLMILQQISFAQSIKNTTEQNPESLSTRLDSVVKIFQENRHFMGGRSCG